MIGSKLNQRYIVTSKLGQGSMGQVYRAFDEQAQHEVAIKVVQPEPGSSGEDDQWRFRREAKTLISLDHPNIVDCYALGEMEGSSRFFLVMELLKGRVLSSHLHESDRLALDMALEIVMQIASALAYIHQRGIVHRDIKPSNVMVQLNGSVATKLLDFGLAHLADEKLSSDQALVGTFPYMSPEQTGIIHQPLDGRSDLYSLGVTFYHLVTGQLPFRGTSVNALIHQHVAKRPVPPSELNESTPDDVERMIMRLLEKDVTARYQTADGLVADIERYRAGQTGFELATDPRKQEQVYNTIGLVGREQELEQLNLILDRAFSGNGRVLLLSGAPGIGKSRLMDELRTTVVGRNGTFLTGGCDEANSRVPFQPLKAAIASHVQRVRQRGGKAGIEKLLSVGKKYGGILSQVMPELKMILPQVGPPPPPDIPARARKRLFLTALVELFSRWAAETPLVLLLEDVHWIDLGTIQFLELAASRVSNSPWLVALTAVDESSGHPRRLTRYIRGAKEHAGLLNEISLKRFGLKTMQRFIQQKLGQAPQNLKSIAQLVLQRTNGIPYEASSYVESLVTDGILYREEEGWLLDEAKFDTLRYSTEVVNTIVRRLALIDRGKYHLLALAAVIGSDFEFELLKKLSGRSGDEVMDALEDAQRHRLILQQGNQLHYRFTHQKIKDTLYKRLATRVTERTHRRIAMFLQEEMEQGDDEQVYRLAHHYDQANDTDNALIWLLKAGELALAEFSIRDAREYFIRAKHYLQDPGGQRTLYLSLEEQLGDANNMLSKTEEALLAYAHVLDVAVDEATRRRIRRKIGMLHQQSGDSRQAVRYLEESLTGWGIWIPKSRFSRGVSVGVQVVRFVFYGLLSMLGMLKTKETVAPQDRELVKTYETLSFSTFYFDLFRTYDYHLRHYNVLSRLGRKHKDVIASMMHAIASLDRGWVKRSLRFYRIAIQLMKKLTNPSEIARALKFQGAYLWSTGKIRNSVTVMRRAISASEETGNAHDLYENLSILCNLYLDHGDFRSAIGAAERLAQSPYARDKMAAFLGDAMAQIYVGKRDKAYEMLEKAWAELEKTVQPGAAVMMHYVSGHVYHKAGDLDRALEALQTAYSLNQKEHIPRPIEIRGMIYMLELDIDLIRRRPEDKALRRRFKRLLRRTRGLGRSFICYHSYIDYLEAAYLELCDRPDMATRKMRKAVQALRKNGMKYMHARSLTHFAKLVYGGAGEPMSKALSLYQEMGLNSEAREIQKRVADRRRSNEDSSYSSYDSSGDNQLRGYLTHKRELASLLEINQAISAVLDYDDLLKKIMDSVIRFVGAERGFLMTYDNRGELEVQVARNIDKQTIEAEAFRVSRNIINRVVESEKPILISDAEADPEFSTAESVVRYNLRSILCIPLKHGKTLLGVLYLENNLIRNLFTEADVDLLSVLATQATISIQNARLFRMATTDSLTDVYLRRFMENRLKEEFDRSQRYGNSLSLLMLDVDHFKKVNDTYGHQVGDDVLMKVAALLKHSLRDTDLVARYGGEEFCMILPETAREKGHEVAERLRENIEQTDFDPVPEVTVSIGLATIPAELICHPRELIEAADKALYKAKQSGRNRVEIAE